MVMKMTTKTVSYNKTGIESLPDNKPLVYIIKTERDKTNYVGIAQRGRPQERIGEHLGEIPGAKVQIIQVSSIDEAREMEARLIKKEQPKYNKQGK